MSSFQHNPYQQFSPPQPVPSSPSSVTSRKTVLHYRHHQPQLSNQLIPLSPKDARTASLTRHATRSVRVSLPSPVSRSASTSSPSHNTSFRFSCDATGTAISTRGESDLLVASGGDARAAQTPDHVRHPSFSNPRTPQSIVLPSAATSTCHTSLQSQVELQWQQSECVSARNSGNTSTAAMAPAYPFNTNAMEVGYEDHISIIPGQLHVAAAAQQFLQPPADAQTTMNANGTATLFIDGLPPTIENQYQLCPYVPPQGRVRVRVKRSRGRDVGFAEYESVDAAAAALEWFQTIRMLCESVQSSTPSSPWMDTSNESGCVRGGASDAMSSFTPLPVAFEDFLALRHSPAEYGALLRHSVCLSVEWARTPEAPHPRYPSAVLTLSQSLLTPTQLKQQQQHWRCEPLMLPPAVIAGDAGPYNEHRALPPLPQAFLSNFFCPQQQQQQQLPMHPGQQAAFDNAGVTTGTTTTAAAAAQPPSSPPFALPKWAGQAPQDTQHTYAEDPATAGHAAASADPAAPFPGPASLRESSSPTAEEADGERKSGSDRGSLSQSSNSAEGRNGKGGDGRKICSFRGVRWYPPASLIDASLSNSCAAANTPFTAATSFNLPPHHDQQAAFASCPCSPVRGRQERRLPSRTLFVKLTHNFPLPASLTSCTSGEQWHDPSAGSTTLRGSFDEPFITSTSGNYISGGVGDDLEPAAMSVDESELFALAQQVCREDFFTEQFAGVLRYRPFLHPPYYGGCFVLFQRDTDMQRCLQWMRSDARLMSLFAVQPARTDTLER